MVLNRFRWVFCQLEMLQNCLPQNVRRVLRELPRSLDETYERVLNGIGAANQRQAHRLLQCLTVATRPLRVEELAEVLALDFDEAKDGIPALNKDWRWDDQKQGILSTCSSLVVIVDWAGIVQFAHFSVKEFLTSDRLADLKADISHFHISLEPAHTIIAQACLGVLLLSDYNGDDHNEAKYNTPLTGYAAQYWVAHAQFENASFRVQVGMQRLFDPTKPYFAAWLKSYNIDREWWPFRSIPFNKNHAQDLASLCLYFASFCGFRDLTKHLIAKYPRDVNASVGLNQSPLAAALYNNHLQVAEVLRQHGASLDVIGHRGCTLLHAASSDGKTDVAQWLLNIGANANAEDDKYITPLHLAAGKGHLELVQTLLRQSVDVDAPDEDNRTPLHEASAGGHVDIVRLLIQHGADAIKDLQRLLLLASSSASTETVQFFIQFGADVNVRDENHSTPLHRASSVSDNAETVRLLIKHNADIHAQDWGHKTPLHLASSSWLNDETVQLLIEHGADIHAQDQYHRTPLHLALLSPAYEETVQLLIDHGANVHARDQNQSTPLHLALLSPGYDKTVQLLIDHGANVHARDENQSTPLHLASSTRDNAKPVQLLIEHGADVHAQDEKHKTPLHLASSTSGTIETVQLLIEHGADVHAQDISLSTPLHLASLNERTVENVQLLIKNGADVHAQDQNHDTPLHLASSCSENDKSVQLLIEHGADVHARDQSHYTPLHMASSLWGTTNTVQLLIKHGADIHARDESHSTPLHLASSSTAGVDTVGLLIEHGADVHAQDQSQKTPLHLVSSCMGYFRLQNAHLLIEHGADVHALDQYNKTPLHVAFSWGEAEIVKLLIEHGADFHAQDQFQRTPLDLVSSYRQDDETRRVFMEHKADCPVCRTNDHNHKIPLHLESHGEEFENETVQQHHRRDGTPRDPANTFAFASGVVRDELKLPLIEHPSDDNACDSDRSHSTPLHLEIVHQGPVAVGVEDDKGQSPFEIASSGGDHKIPRMLVSEYLTSVE